MPKKDYPRDKPGERLQFRGMNTVLPPDAMPQGKFVFAQNVRAYLRDRVTNRASQDSSVGSLPTSVHTIRRLNDSTPAGPVGGFILVDAASDKLYANTTQVAHGLSGNPLSFLPFRPNASVQPWMYVGDSKQSGVVIDSGSNATPNGMLKVRSDGLCYAMGIAEPQSAPTITSIPAASGPALVGPVSVSFWFDSPHSGPVAQYIWRNANDTGSGPIRTATAPNGSTTGNSLEFDAGLVGIGSGAPVEWTSYQTNFGTVNTDDIGGTHNVHWQSGTQFGDLAPAGTITINAVTYTIATVPSNVLLTLTATAGVQNGVIYQAVAGSGTYPLFQPAPGGEGYAHFNCVIQANLYIPVAGNHTISALFKDDIIWGIGSSAQGTASLVSYTGGSYFGQFAFVGQTKTAIQGYPLLPRNPDQFDPGSGFGEAGTRGGSSCVINFSAPGNYPIEIDWDYWFHSGRTLVIMCDGSPLQPIPGTNIMQAQYRYTYRSSATGATSNPSPESPEQGLSVLANTLSAVASTDPQVDKIDWYRLDTGLLNFTYVGTGPNSTAPFNDILLDADVAGNPLLEFDNFQPFPSIDLPRKGTVNCSGGVATWVSGDQFNIRWLPGTIIIVGTIAYTLDKRPTSNVQLTASNIEIVGGIANVVPLANGTNLPYEIAQPILAAQALAYIWGPTDNVSFFFGVGDPLRPGTLYWSKGNNPDSAPDTNQQDLTSPSEPLQNGCIVNGIGLVMSTERGFLIYPNFFNALATVQGTTGATWTIQESISTRGLYMPRALAVDGGGNVFFRAKDGVCISPAGQGATSITDEDLYNLFPHEGMIPQAVTRGGYTVYPPDDTRPQAQKMNVANGYLYYDYQDVNGTPRTLAFDIEAKGWVWDSYQYPVAVHVLEEGAGVNGVLTGCSDGSIRPLTNTGAEQACAILLTKCENAGDTRAPKHWGDLWIEAGPRGS